VVNVGEAADAARATQRVSAAEVYGDGVGVVKRQDRADTSAERKAEGDELRETLSRSVAARAASNE
jgi:hypothetical protein